MKSYSQYGEDLAIMSMFPSGYAGTVLEVGAWEPIALSNSRLFIEAGWSAILVEPSPVPLRALLEEYGRNPKVRIFAAGVGTACDDRGPVFSMSSFDISDGPLSTEIESAREQWASEAEFVGKLNVPMLPPDFAHEEPRIDFLSVDTEGNSYDVLAAMLRDWSNPPNVICVERQDGAEYKFVEVQRRGYEIVPHDPSGGVNRILRRKDWRL